MLRFLKAPITHYLFYLYYSFVYAFIYKDYPTILSFHITVYVFYKSFCNSTPNSIIIFKISKQQDDSVFIHLKYNQFFLFLIGSQQPINSSAKQHS